MNCKDCKYWGTSDLLRRIGNVKTCENPKWHKIEDDMPKKFMEKDTVQVPYFALTAPDFGCIHFTKND